jgi:acyl-CoA synthetase (AMP-forming)/AMP-acid ligase II
VLKANAVVSMVNPLTKADKLAYLINDCRATALITDSHLANVYQPALERSGSVRAVIVSGSPDAQSLAKLPNGVTWEAALAGEDRATPPARTGIDIDLAAIVYTSGSTGDPKGVMLTHRNMLTAATSVSTYLGLRETDVTLMVLPMAFDYGLYQMVMAFRVGARVVIERSFAFPAAVLNVMAKEGVTVFPGVPTIYAMLIEMSSLSSFDLSRIRMVTNTAAALPLKHIERLRELFPTAQLFSMYGLTECHRCTYLPPADLPNKPGSVGIAIPDTEMWLVDENDKRVPAGQVGQLVIRGATVMRGYWDKPEATAKKLRPGPLPGEMVLYTGDYGRMDEDGYLYFVGRMDDIIKSRGEKVAPKEVENAITNIPGVKETAVIGVPDDVLGQAVKAFVVREQGATLTEKDVQRECQSRLENFMVPKFVVFVDDLPKTTTGKIRKTGLS